MRKQIGGGLAAGWLARDVAGGQSMTRAVRPGRFQIAMSVSVSSARSRAACSPRLGLPATGQQRNVHCRSDAPDGPDADHGQHCTFMGRGRSRLPHRRCRQRGRGDVP